jgi:hypothetical protein
MLPARATFTYDIVPAVTAAALRAEASRIRKMVNTTTAAIIEIGCALISVKQSLDHGQFSEWVQAECGFGLRTAENYIKASQFAEGKTKCVSLLNPATVYRLAAKSAPPEIVQAVLDRAANGEVVADGEVIAAFDEIKFQKREAERQQKKSTQRADSKKVREQREREHLQQEERLRKEEERIRVIALSIIETLGEENTHFLLKSMGKYNGWSILDRVRTEFCKSREDLRDRADLEVSA